MKCGVLWYLHIPKTGGTTIMHHFHDLHERYNWQYANMWKLQVPPNEKGPPGSPYHWTAWNTTKKWTNVVLPELSQAQPRLIVHAHHNMPGLGDPYMFNQVLMPMKRSLEAKGCELRLATALREPVSEVVSLMLFRQIPFEEFIPRMEENSDAMSKYILWNYHTQWPLEYQRGTTPNANGVKLLQRSRELLSKFSLVGQTENLNQFIHFINLALGWPTSDVPRPWVTGSMKHTRAFTPYTPSAQMLERVKGANVVDSLLYHTFCSKAQAAPQSPTSTVALAAPQAEQAAPDGMIAPMAARRALDAVFETAPPVAVQAPAPAKHGAATIHGATQLSAPFDQPAQTAPAQTVANNTNTEEAAVLGTPAGGSSSALAASAAVPVATMTVSAAAEKLGTVGSVAEAAAVVAATVALAAPSEPAAGAGASEPAATDETAPMIVDNGDPLRLAAMLSREMALRAEVRLELESASPVWG